MDVECYKITLKPDALPIVREWAKRLKSEINEVRQLLKKEGIVVESVFLEEDKDGAHIIYYLRSPDFKKAREVSKASQHPIDIYHRDVMQKIAASNKTLECLFDATAE